MHTRQLSSERVESVLAHLRRHHPRTYLWALLAVERGIRPGEIPSLRTDDPLLRELGGHPLPLSHELARVLEQTAPEGVICRNSAAYVSQTFHLQSEHDGLAAISLQQLRRHFLASLTHAVQAGEMSPEQATAMARFKARPAFKASTAARPAFHRPDDITEGREHSEH